MRIDQRADSGIREARLPTVRSTWPAYLLLAAFSIALAAESNASSSRVIQQPPIVVAVVGEAGVNLLHEDFRHPQGHALPASAPRGPSIKLPTTGDFASRVASSRQLGLGRLQRDVLYRIRNNRIAAVIAPSSDVNGFGTAMGFTGRDPVDLFADPQHGTGVASALVSRRLGTAPHVAVVMVLGGGASAWRWIAEQPWIEFVSASYVIAAPGASSPPDQSICPLYRESEALRARGALAAVASTNDPGFGTAFAPASFPGVYHVGGVRESGEPVILDALDTGSVTTKVGPDRPYDSGELFAFRAAASDALTGDMAFGGTSGATPRLVGRAADLLAQARSVLGDSSGGTHAGLLAQAPPGGPRPARGPLADGALTATELAEVLRHTSKPFVEFDPSLSFLAEGFGATTADTLSAAKLVMAGKRPLPSRAEEKSHWSSVDLARQALWGSRCTPTG